MSDPATVEDKEQALKMFQERRVRGATEEKIDDSGLYAGSDMHYDCLACGCQDIVLPETWVPPRPKFCAECQALKDKGWLDEATAQPTPEVPVTPK